MKKQGNNACRSLIFQRMAFLYFSIFPHTAWKAIFLHPGEITEIDFHLVDTVNEGEQMV